MDGGALGISPAFLTAGSPGRRANDHPPPPHHRRHHGRLHRGAACRVHDRVLGAAVTTARTEITLINKKIYDKSDSDINTLYDIGRKVSLAHFETLYKRLGSSFDFHFYDLDFCRQAELKGLKMGTWSISVIHESRGNLGPQGWWKAYKKYFEKWGE